MRKLACPREAYGRYLVKRAAEDERIVALDADLSGSTMSCLLREQYPERHFEMGIGEQNMVAVAAGLALGGKIPFVHSFAVFLTGRAFEQVRQSVALAKANVKLVGSSYGFSDFGDGATHQALEDVAIMRALPNMTVLVPMDPGEVEEAVDLALEIRGPVYIRISRSPMEYLPKEEPGLGPALLQDGKDLVVFANGLMTSLALEAREILAQEGISLRVVNVSCVKPLAKDGIQRLAADVKGVITVEEHSVIGGLGSAVLEALALTPKPTCLIGVEDAFGQSAQSHGELLAHYGLTTEAICERARFLMGRG
ncbi:MAG: transketolase C-terminal domain-containing protein [Limnochordia bacterium]|jgi:transketolase|nr:transketolase C-terminal domain-containing protein [Limnochordia bacterium]MDI9465824.1 transketolase C-terminal domain-containing protein [Bacillota bacterium]NLO96250.1 transketolase family protein [Bacillota bacterium]HAN94769.1 transketolase [Bacillota bacterium]HOB41183.1 transketolase C-terminal domain-containing protein [Limnochordia bacterium]